MNPDEEALDYAGFLAIMGREPTDLEYSLYGLNSPDSPPYVPRDLSQDFLWNSSPPRLADRRNEPVPDRSDQPAFLEWVSRNSITPLLYPDFVSIMGRAPTSAECLSYGLWEPWEEPARIPDPPLFAPPPFPKQDPPLPAKRPEIPLRASVGHADPMIRWALERNYTSRKRSQRLRRAFGRLYTDSCCARCLEGVCETHPGGGWRPPSPIN
jgi:hypothetical protein